MTTPRIECDVCGAATGLDAHPVVAAAEVAAFVAAHSSHDRFSIAALLPRSVSG
jgi:hypothetical protein